MFLTRLPTVWLGMVMVLSADLRQLTYNAHRSRRVPLRMALLAVTLVSLTRTYWHTRLITTDLGLVAAAVLATYLLWRYLRLPSWRDAVCRRRLWAVSQHEIYGGVVCAVFALLSALASWLSGGQWAFPTKMIGQLLIAYPLAAVLTLWAAARI